MLEVDYVGRHLDERIVAVRARAEAERVARRARWDASVEAASTAWLESFGYKVGTIVDDRLVQREAREMVALVMKARLLMMFAPLFVMAEGIDRSLHIVSILASPSGAGPERYAPRELRVLSPYHRNNLVGGPADRASCGHQRSVELDPEPLGPFLP